MKKIIAAAAMILLGGAAVNASNYPMDYTYQYARVVSAGPAIVASVSSGIMSKMVIGYKRGGILGNSDSLSAVVRTTYSDNNGYVSTVERVFQMPKEWHGTGFMTMPLSPYDLVSGANYRQLLRIELAFSNGPKWDSNYGGNYVVEQNDFYKKAEVFRSEHAGSPDIDLYCWDFIVNQMRK